MTRLLYSLALAALATAVPAFSQSDGTETSQARIEELEKRIARLEERLRQLEAEPSAAVEEPAPEVTEEERATDFFTASADSSGEAPPQVASSAPTSVPEVPEAGQDLASSETRLPFSGYMDFHFNNVQNEPSQLDFHRFVLLFGHSFSDRIQFWSELELEHAFVSGEGELGELELEQAYLDFLVKPWLNFRGGILLAPVGLINERHEPPAFNGVERPFVDTVIIPSTWFDSGAGIFGDLGHGFVYKAYVMSPLDATAFDAEEGIRGGRQKAFQSVVQNTAYTGRLEYHGFPGLSLGGSVWWGNTGFNLPDINPRVRVFSFDGRYSFSRFDFRGQFARVDITRTDEINFLTQFRTGVNPNIAREMRGFYWESAYHLLPRHFPHDFVAFARYENFDTQRRMAAGFLPLKQFDRSAWVIGGTYYPEPDVALKFDYTVLRNQSSIIEAHNSLNLGIGWWF